MTGEEFQAAVRAIGPAVGELLSDKAGSRVDVVVIALDQAGGIGSMSASDGLSKELIRMRLAEALAALDNGQHSTRIYRGDELLADLPPGFKPS